MGTVGRESVKIRLDVLYRTTKAEVQSTLKTHRTEFGVVYSDESKAYFGVKNETLDHKTVCHSIKEWARDDDGDGINEVHNNTMEGIWTELRNHLRSFKGVSKHYIHLYCAMFEWIFNYKQVEAKIIKMLLLSDYAT